jgi:iron complex outermembrane receptor protein
MPHHYKQFILFCILFTCTGFALKAQTFKLKGKVTAAGTGEELVGVSVFSSNNFGAATNALGDYELTLAANKIDTITFSYVGFYTKQFVYNPVNYKERTLDRTLVINIQLEEKAILTEELIITAGRSEKKLRDATVSIELIKPYLFTERNNVNIDDGINQIPGVSFIDGQASIRGGSGWSYGAGTRVLVLLDDMPMVSGDANQVQWSYIPIESIEQVEVLKGASSVLYGSSALNGVINIRTIRPKGKPYTAVNLFSGFYDNTLRQGLKWQGDRLLSNSGANIVHAQRWNNFEGTFSVNHLNDEGFRMGEPERRTRFSFNTRYTPKKVKNLIYGINGNVMSSRVGSFLLWESFELGYTQLDSGFNYTNTTRYNVDPYVIFYTGETRHNIRGRYFYLDNNVDNGDPTNDQSNTSNYYYAEYQFQNNIERWKLDVVGGVAGNYTITNSPLFQGVQVSANLAPFLQLERKWKKLTVNAGARYENFRLNDYVEAKPVFRAGVNYGVGKTTFLRASYGQGYRFPSIVETFVRTSSGPLQVYPNPDLRSETGWNTEIAIKQGLKLGK